MRILQQALGRLKIDSTKPNLPTPGAHSTRGSFFHRITAVESEAEVIEPVRQRLTGNVDAEPADVGEVGQARECPAGGPGGR
jgi:hypothetical protein